MQKAFSLQQMITCPLAEAGSRNAGTVFFWPGECPRGLIASEMKQGSPSRYRRVELGVPVSPADFTQAMAIAVQGVATVTTAEGVRWTVTPAPGVLIFTRIAKR